jgi:hypothetical protein
LGWADYPSPSTFLIVGILVVVVVVEHPMTITTTTTTILGRAVNHEVHEEHEKNTKDLMFSLPV